MRWGGRMCAASACPGRFRPSTACATRATWPSGWAFAFDIVPITPAYDEMLRTLAPVFAGRKPDVTEENIQARLRGLTLMALSNKFGALVLTTGNKSEMAVGYCTLYGDMCGGLAVISDVPKTHGLFAVAHRQPPARRGHPRIGVRKAAIGRAAAGSERQRFAPALRRARRASCGFTSKSCAACARSHRNSSLPLELVRDVALQGGPQRIQTAAGRARAESNLESVRHRPPLSHRAAILGERMKTRCAS